MRLSDATLRRLSLPPPAYDRAALCPGVLHLGPGHFFRAHVARYIEDLATRSPDWGIAAASVQGSAAAMALARQDGLYTVSERGPDAVPPRIFGAVCAVLTGDRVLTALSDPAIRLVTLTVTEKGYNPAATTPNSVAGKAAFARNVPGLLAAGLAARRRQGHAPPVILSCDNLSANGLILRRAVTAAAAQQDPALAAWIGDSVAFPSSMVDRITPATTPRDRAEIAKTLGAEDAAAVVAEPFRQWVIEDPGLPALAALGDVGVRLVGDVAPYETMKLRLLNGAHTVLAAYGGLLDLATVAEAVAHPPLRRTIQRMMAEEVAPTVPLPPPVLRDYQRALLTRFANPALAHRTAQIAMDASLKVPQRLLAPIRARLAAGHGAARLIGGVAAWILGLARGARIADPLSEEFALMAGAAGHDPRAFAAMMMDRADIFGDLGQNAAFRAALFADIRALAETGPAALLERP
ncbi:MAG: mannitol dehydrogenase family protein [Pseudomonadota bacterium]